MITAKELAEKINGREYMNEMTKEEEAMAKEAGLVVVFGYSDDNIEFRGAIDDEIGAYDGGEYYISPDGKVFDEETPGTKRLDAVWCDPESEHNWSYKTDIPHEKFTIMDEGEKFCEGIIFSMEDLKKV